MTTVGAATNRRARLATIELPEFGAPEHEPQMSPALFTRRMEQLQERMDEAGVDRVLVYADREHSANIAFLTGFEPRFEEALLVVSSDAVAVLVGNECWGTAGAGPLTMRRYIYSGISPTLASRASVRALSEILAAEGIVQGSRVGLIGWKAYSEPWMSDVPAYIVDTVRATCGADNVSNVTGLLNDAQGGLRVINEPEQIAYLEWAACHVSDGVRRLLFNLEPGMTEHEAVSLLHWNGTPLSCHLMLTAGPRAKFGLLSPSDRAIARGDPFTTAYGIWGALTCRAGFVVAHERELPESIRDYVERLVAPYFVAVAEWLEAVHVGQTGGVLNEIIARRLGDSFFGIFLNPGHQIHLDEWVNSPVWPDSVGRAPLGHGPTGRHHPGHGHGLLHDEHRGRHCPGRPGSAGNPGVNLSGDVAAHLRAAPIHGRPARHPASSGCSAAIESDRLPAAVPAAARSRADPRLMSIRTDVL